MFHCRDESRLEADCDHRLPDGRWAAFDVKLGLNETEAAAAHLRKLLVRVDSEVMGTPAALAVSVRAVAG